MPKSPDREYLEKVSSETGFLRDPLEKVYRLLELLGTITSAPDIEGKLLLKGGTALQFVYLDYRRLSVDIDFNYVGSVEKEVMEKDRDRIRDMLSRIFNEYGYVLEKNVKHYAEEQYILAYTNCVGNKDRIKVEINFLERMPLLPVVDATLKHPFDVLDSPPIPTFQYEEAIAQKTRALITRATPRDLYDVYLISQNPLPLDKMLYRKLVLFYLSLTAEDVRNMTTDMISDIIPNSVRQHLAPVLKRREYNLDLDEMKRACLEFVRPILDFTPEELEFFDNFYEKKMFDQDLLFNGVEIRSDLNEHPGVKWRRKN